MGNFWQRWREFVAPGAGGLAILLVVAGIADLVLGLGFKYDFASALDLTSGHCRAGQVWRLLTYALIPANCMDWLMGLVAIIVVGRMLAPHWNRYQFWTYCAVVTAAAGGAKVLVDWSSPLPLRGTGPIALGLLLGWGFLAGRETVQVIVLGEMRVWTLVLAAAGVSLGVMLFTAGWVPAVVLAAGGGGGLLFLWLGREWMMARPAQAVQSQRIHRLEL